MADAEKVSAITFLWRDEEKEMEETGRPRGGTNTAYSKQKKLFTKIGQNFFGFSLFLEWNMIEYYNL